MNLAPSQQRKSGPVNLVQLYRARSADSGLSAFPVSPNPSPHTPLTPLNIDRPAPGRKPYFAPVPGSTDVVRINVRRTLRRPAKLNWRESARLSHEFPSRESNQNLGSPTPETEPVSGKSEFLFRTLSPPEGNATPILRKNVKRYKITRATSSRLLINDSDLAGNKPMENTETPRHGLHLGKPVPFPSSSHVERPISETSCFHIGKSAGNGLGQEDDMVAFSRQPSVRESSLFAVHSVLKEKVHDQNHHIQIVVQEPPPPKLSKTMSTGLFSTVFKQKLTKEL